MFVFALALVYADLAFINLRDKQCLDYWGQSSPDICLCLCAALPLSVAKPDGLRPT